MNGKLSKEKILGEATRMLSIARTAVDAARERAAAGSTYQAGALQPGIPQPGVLHTGQLQCTCGLFAKGCCVVCGTPRCHVHGVVSADRFVCRTHVDQEQIDERAAAVLSLVVAANAIQAWLGTIRPVEERLLVACLHFGAERTKVGMDYGPERIEWTGAEALQGAFDELDEGAVRTFFTSFIGTDVAMAPPIAEAQLRGWFAERKRRSQRDTVGWTFTKPLTLRDCRQMARLLDLESPPPELLTQWVGASKRILTMHNGPIGTSPVAEALHEGRAAAANGQVAAAKGPVGPVWEPEAGAAGPLPPPAASVPRPAPTPGAGVPGPGAPGPVPSPSLRVSGSVPSPPAGVPGPAPAPTPPGPTPAPVVLTAEQRIEAAMRELKRLGVKPTRRSVPGRYHLSASAKLFGRVGEDQNVEVEPAWPVGACTWSQPGMRGSDRYETLPTGLTPSRRVVPMTRATEGDAVESAYTRSKRGTEPGSFGGITLFPETIAEALEALVAKHR
jgi:hypothetical protein